MIHHSLRNNPAHHFAVAPSADRMSVLLQVQDSTDQARIQLAIEEVAELIVLLQDAAVRVKTEDDPARWVRMPE